MGSGGMLGDGTLRLAARRRRHNACAPALLVAIGFAVCLAIAAPAAAQTTSDPAGDSPAGPSGGVDVREVRWSREAATTTLAVRWLRTPSPTGAATPRGRVHGDVNGDLVADVIVAFAVSDGAVAWELQGATGGAAGCQPAAGTLRQGGTAALAAVGGGVEEWQAMLPTAQLDRGAGMRWALSAFTEGATPAQSFWDAVPDASSGGGASPDDRRCGAGPEGWRADLAHGATLAAVPAPPPPPAPLPQPPVAQLALAGATAVAGKPLSLDASGSRDPDGQIVAFEWDWNGDGRYEANTGTRPTALFAFGGRGPRTIGVRVTDTQGLQSVASLNVELAASPPGCESKLDLSLLRIAAACIRRQGTRYTIESDASHKLIVLNGIGLVANTTGAWSLTLDLAARTLSTKANVAVRLLNTPLGNITIYRAKAGFTWSLTSGGTQAAATPGFRLATFGAGAGCTAEDTCAVLPGGFPLTGQVDVYLTSGLEIVIDAHAKLETVFTVTGNVRLRAAVGVGLKLDTLKFDVENAQFGIFELRKLAFAYDAPGTIPNLPPGADRWHAELDVVLPTPTPAKSGIRGSLTFVNGKFSAGSATLTLLNGIVIGPGVTLNKFGGTFGTKPDLMIGGNLGIGLVKVGQIDGNFLYVRRSDGVKAVHVDGTYSILGHPLASAYFDYQSNGYTAFGGMFAYKSPPLDVIGNVNAWFEGRQDGTRRFQIEGQVSVRVWVINGTAKAVINTDWIAACGQVEVFAKLTKALDRPPVYVSGYAAYNRNSGKIEGFFGCDLGSYRIAPSIAPVNAAQAGDRRFAVAPGQKALGLTVRGSGGAPVVRLHAPGGRTFTTPADDEVVQADGFLAARGPGDQTTIRLDRPAAGTWRIEALPGSPAVGAVLSAQPLASRPVQARVLGSGRTRTLEYRFDRPAGGAVRFVERGRDVNRVLGVTTKRSGRIRFTAADGRGGQRRIEATLELDGAARSVTTVARYSAPGPVVPGRPARVRARRTRGDVVIAWRAAVRATGYEIRVRGSDGRRLLLRTTARQRRVTVKRVLASERLTISVRGEYRPTGRTGRAGTVLLRRR